MIGKKIIAIWFGSKIWNWKYKCRAKDKLSSGYELEWVDRICFKIENCPNPDHKRALSDEKDLWEPQILSCFIRNKKKLGKWSGLKWI